MAQDRESEVRLLFLTEAREYLDEVESDLLNLSQGGVDRPTLDRMLRAVHSIKGGGAMMGFMPLSDIAHRVEDFFNILKSGRVKAIATGLNNTDLSNLERLFLVSVDKMREVITFHGEGREVKSEWLEAEIAPIFNQLHNYLGEYSLEDNASVISADAGEDMRTFMFETEVDTCLERLEQVLSEPNSPVVREEFLIASQELGCLGEMLDLQAFALLCESVTEAISSKPTPLEMRQIAESAVKFWRRSQALVLIGQFDSLPYSIPMLIDQVEQNEDLAEFSIAINDEEILDINLDVTSDLAIAIDESDLNEIKKVSSEIILESFNDDAFIDNFISEFVIPDAIVEPDIKPTPQNLPNQYVPNEKAQLPQKIQDKLKTLSVRESSSNENENTIRVPARQLNQLADLSGEFISERNTLNLQLKQFRTLVELLKQRVQTLEQSNSLLRSSYDRVSTFQPATPVLLNQSNYRFSNGFNVSKFGSEFGDRFDALEMDRYSDLHLISRDIMDNVVQLEEVTSDIETALAEVEVTEREFGRTNKQMQLGITQVRMRPLTDILSRFPRLIREMSVQYGKQVELKIRGGNILIERNILEALTDPLLHLIRNAFDHGIESPEVRTAQDKSATGIIEIAATSKGNQTTITVQDDGNGINLDKVRAKAIAIGVSADDLNAVSKQEILELIFEPGFSTASKVTNLSGRGVGMDVVRSNLKGVGGTISIATTQGEGTTFTIAIPVSLSVIKVLLVESKGMIIGIPISEIEEMLVVNSESNPQNINTNFIEWEGYNTPIIHLHQYLQFPSARRYTENRNSIINQSVILIVSKDSQPYAIQCDRYWGQQEIATRSVDGIQMPRGFASCTILDSKVVPIADIEALLELVIDFDSYAHSSSSLSKNRITDKNRASDSQNNIQNITRKTIMIVDDSINVRRFLALTLEKSGYQVEQAKDGQEALEKLQTLNQTLNAVICDVEMPRLDGFGFLAQSQSEAKFKHIPVVMLTSRSSNKHRQLAMNLGATAYFSKPFKEAELLETLSQLTSLTSGKSDRLLNPKISL